MATASSSINIQVRWGCSDDRFFHQVAEKYDLDRDANMGNTTVQERLDDFRIKLNLFLGGVADD